MAVFSKNDRKKSTESIAKGATIIAVGTKIKGDIVLSSSLHIDGEIEGIIHSDNLITIGPKGQVRGEIIAKNLVINGVFSGVAESHTVEILSKGNVKGKLIYSELVIEKGAAFDGETSVRPVVIEESNASEVSEDKTLGVSLV
ncbi:MAG: polymer-forming cytoskeletal family protein [Methylomarinum sp.]|nr:polymer-forming cytoskeletal family protein [Methylomarinum sp.]